MSLAHCSSPRGWFRAQNQALISLLALNGLRICEATEAEITAIGTERMSPAMERQWRTSRHLLQSMAYATTVNCPACDVPALLRARV